MEVELTTAVDSIVRARWELRAGQVIPETEDITLGNSGVTLEATVLYADLADSTELALYDQEIAAEVCKAYLVGTTRLIKAVLCGRITRHPESGQDSVRGEDPVKRRCRQFETYCSSCIKFRIGYPTSNFAAKNDGTEIEVLGPPT
ncbi:MAG: hypothetical protein ABSH31_12915 [Bryobacteraceae bacterium]|jgi:hypothetical protein